jgi:hypothetical protein
VIRNATAKPTKVSSNATITATSRPETITRRSLTTSSIVRSARRSGDRGAGPGSGWAAKTMPYPNSSAPAAQNAARQPSPVASAAASSAGPARSPTAARRFALASAGSARSPAASTNDTSAAPTSRSAPMPITHTATIRVQKSPAAANTQKPAP